LYKYVPENIPQFMGEIAKQVMLVKTKILAKSSRIENVTLEDVEKLETFKTFKAEDRIEVGDICVTPYFVSHSACDAYMFLIEADGKNILHTGDFREHGYLGKGLEKVLKAFIIKKGIDVLITEGTMLSRLKERTKHENDLKIEASALLKKYKYSFVLCSSTDIDRLATFHEASKKCGRSLLCDNYQKEILDIFTANTKFKFNNAHFYKHNHEEQFALIKEKGFCMLIRSSKIKPVQELLERLPAKETLLIYSMWDGYINEKVKNGDNIVQGYLDIWNLFENKEKIHTSGHATAETLTKVCQLVNPKTAIIPIHSKHSADMLNLEMPAELKEKVITTSCKKDDIEIKIL
jgi:ribonuclease J